MKVERFYKGLMGHAFATLDFDVCVGEDTLIKASNWEQGI